MLLKWKVTLKKYRDMEMEIKLIIGSKLYKGLSLGKPTERMLRVEIDNMNVRLGHPLNLAVLFDKNVFTQLVDHKKEKLGYGTWGHIGGANLRFSDSDDNFYELAIIWHYINEKETIEESLNAALGTFDWLQAAHKWHISEF